MAVKRKTVVKHKNKNNSLDKPNRNGIDIPFLVLTLIILVIGLIMMFSAGHVQAQSKYNDSYYFIKRQGIFALLGIIAMFIASRFPMSFYRKMAFPLLVVSVIMLILVIIPGIGIKANGSRRWLGIRNVITFQPSDIAKFAIILVFANIIAANYNKMKTFKYGMLPFGLVIIVCCGLILCQTHFSATLLICFVGLIMMIVGGTNLKILSLIGTIAAAGLVVMMLFRGYSSDRITTWLDPFADPSDDGYQIINSLYAIGSGGLTGLGLGQSRQKYLYLGEAQNDFVFSIVCEELGFIGAMLILCLFILLIWRGFIIAFRAPDKFSCMVVIGIISFIAVQTILNVAVVTSTIPVTGISLPFFSYGGTALTMLLFEIGVVLSVSRYSYMEG
ncbi:MAG: putative lipid II flippase FtsW [Clostridia bacterium]|nr:putative lipid II flippase FtsW [Clostridia bacterium]